MKLWLPVHCPSNRRGESPGLSCAPWGAAPGALQGSGPGPPGRGHRCPKGTPPPRDRTGASPRWTRGKTCPSRRSRGCPRCWQNAPCRRRAPGTGRAGRGSPPGTDTPPAGTAAPPAGGTERRASEQPGHPLSCYCISCPLLHQNDFF